MASVSYIHAVRLHQPVRELEELRQLVNGAYNRDDISMMAFSIHYNHADALKFAVMYAHAEYVEHLLKTHAKEALTVQSCCPVLFMAIYSGFTHIVDLLCGYSKAAGIEKNGRPYLDFSGCMALENGKIPLQVAVELGASDIVRVLLRHGADLMALRRGQHVFKDALSISLSIDGQFQGRFESGDDADPGVWLSIQQFADLQSHFTVRMREDFLAVAKLNNVRLDLQLPISLMKHCRAAVRRYTDPSRLPLRNSGLPRSLEQYVNLE